MSIDGESFDRFTAAKGLEKSCPDCGTNHWNTPALGPSGEDFHRVATTYLPQEDGSSFGAYLLICSNCGHIKSYAAAWVERWIDENG